MRMLMTYTLLLSLILSCGKDMDILTESVLQKQEVTQDVVSRESGNTAKETENSNVPEETVTVNQEKTEPLGQEVMNEASFVADFDYGTFTLNGQEVSKSNLVDKYRVQPKGTDNGVQDNALILPFSALGITGNEFTYWIEVTLPDTVEWDDHNFFAEAGTLTRNHRILHRVLSDQRVATEFYGGQPVSFLGSERSSFSANGGTSLRIQQTVDQHSIITQLGDDAPWEKEGVIPTIFRYLAVGVDLLGYQDFPGIVINRIVVFNKKVEPETEMAFNQGYDVSSFTEELFFDDFNQLDLRTGAPNNYRISEGVWTPRYSYTDSEVSSKGWAATGGIAYKADPAYNWPDNWSPLSVENSILTIRNDRTAGTSLYSEVPVNPATKKPYDWIGGVLTTKHSHTFRAPCYVEARIKFPKGKALWNAFWMYNNYDGHKEIDIAEHWTADLKSYGVAQHNYNGTKMIHESMLTNSGVDLTQDFHRYGVVWADGKLVFLLYGKEVYYGAAPILDR